MKGLFSIISFALINIMGLVQFNIPTLQEKQADHLMIVAHPDDEILWGGDELRRENYVVVCLTNGDNDVRRKEFFSVMKQSGDKGIILSFPDKVAGKRSDWKKEYTQIEKEVEQLMKSREWKKIVTHNPDGEYGHNHHKMTSRIVTDIAEEIGYRNLYYFNHYTKKDDLKKSDEQPYISEAGIKWKGEMMKLYQSQSAVNEKLKHMYGYEKLIPQKEWK